MRMVWVAPAALPEAKFTAPEVCAKSAASAGLTVDDSAGNATAQLTRRLRVVVAPLKVSVNSPFAPSATVVGGLVTDTERSASTCVTSTSALWSATVAVRAMEPAAV